MSKYNFPPELMARFYEGNTTAEETMTILHAAKEDAELKEEIEFMLSFPEDLMEEPYSRLKAKIFSIQPSYVIPMMRMVAQNKSFATSDCVVRCEHEILKGYQADVTLESLRQLSTSKNWLREEGTPLYNIGRLLEEYKLSVVRRYNCSPDTLKQEIQGGCQVIIVVNAEKLYGTDAEVKDPNHAIIVRQIDQNMVTIFDPQQQQECNYPLPRLMEAWKDSQFYMVSVIERGLRQYDPQPIDVEDFSLPDDLKELMEAIAENTHDIWARQRIDEGWQYGEKRDDGFKLHPDLVPFSDLTDSEKEYDRKMACGVLKLVKALGYKIVKEE